MILGGEGVLGLEIVEEELHIAAEGADESVVVWQKAVDSHGAVPPGVQVPGITGERHRLGWAPVGRFSNGPDASVSVQP